MTRAHLSVYQETQEVSRMNNLWSLIYDIFKKNK